jgi:folate-binding protein YgfZ
MRTWKAIELKGKDAQDFLQRLTTVNVRKLSNGEGATGLLLTGTGKVIADFFLLVPETNHYVLVSDNASIDRLAAEFEKLHFSEDFTQEVRPGAAVLKTGAKFSRPFSVTTNEMALSWPLPEGYTVDFTLGSIQSDSGTTEGDWERARILAKIPREGSEWISGETNALDCGFLDYIDRTKGCYPGQEVVERSLNVGHPARALVLLESDVALKNGDELKGGKITSAVGTLALAIVQWAKREDTEFEVVGKGVARCRK